MATTTCRVSCQLSVLEAHKTGGSIQRKSNTLSYNFLSPQAMKITALIILGIAICFASVATADPDHEGPAKFFVLKEQKGDDRFCIGIRESNPGVNDRVVVLKCDRDDDTQKWFAPEKDPAYPNEAGRIRSFANQDLCFYAYKKREKEPIRLQRCDRGNDFSSSRHNIVWDYNGGCPNSGGCEGSNAYAEINISDLNSKCKVDDDRTNCHNLCLSYNGNNLDNEDYLRTKNVDLIDKRCEGADREIWAWGWIYQFDDTDDQ